MTDPIEIKIENEEILRILKKLFKKIIQIELGN